MTIINLSVVSYGNGTWYSTLSEEYILRSLLSEDSEENIKHKREKLIGG